MLMDLIHQINMEIKKYNMSNIQFKINHHSVSDISSSERNELVIRVIVRTSYLTTFMEGIYAKYDLINLIDSNYRFSGYNTHSLDEERLNVNLYYINY